MSASLFGPTLPRGGGGGGGGFTDPMTTRGDLIFRDAANVTARLAAGTAGQVLTSDGTDIAWSSQFEALEEPTGFPPLADAQAASTVTFDDVGLELEIAPTGATFDYWIHGVRYSVATQTATITDTEGLWFFYMDTDGLLYATQTFPGNMLVDKAIAAILYWDSSAGAHLYLGEERHGMNMSGLSHQYLHLVFGTQWISGGALGGFTIGDGSLAAHAEFDCGTVQIADEDLFFTFSDGAPQDLTPILRAPIFYLSGTGDWNKDAATDYTCKRFGVADRLAWNRFLGGTWSQVEVTNGDYVLVHIIATNDVLTPIIAIQGQAEYANLPQAREGATTELDSLVTAGLPFAEFTPLGSVIFQTSDGYGNAVKARVVQTDEGGDYVDFRSVQRASAGSATDHGNLAGLADDDHLQYALLDGRAGGQILLGGTASGDDLQLGSTSNATKGTVFVDAGDFFAVGTSTMAGDEWMRVDADVATGDVTAMAVDSTLQGLGFATDVVGIDLGVNVGAICFITDAVGQSVDVIVAGGSSGTTITGLEIGLGVGASTGFLNAYGVHVKAAAHDGANISNSYGLYVGDLESNTSVGNAYGVYIADQSALANNYGVYQAGTDDLNVFMGDVAVGSVAMSGTEKLYVLDTEESTETDAARIECIKNAAGDKVGWDGLRINYTHTGDGGVSGTVNGAWVTCDFQPVSAKTLAGATGYVSRFTTNADGTITNAIHFIAGSATGAGTVTTNYCFYAADQTTATTSYGLYVADMGATTNWGIYVPTASHKNYLEGFLGIGTDTQAGTELLNVDGDAVIGGKLTVTGLIDPTGLKLAQQASDPGSTGAGEGTIWVKSDDPTTLWFTDSDGTDVQLGAGGGGGLTTYADVATAKAATGVANNALCYVVTTETIYRCDTSTSLAADDLHVLTVNSGSDQWLAVAGTYHYSWFLSTYNVDPPNDYSTAFGEGAGGSRTTATYSTYFGYNAGLGATSAGYNTFVGALCGESIDTAANDVTLIGFKAGRAMGSGSDFCVGIGGLALETCNGDRNIGIGYQAGATITGDENVFIGFDCGQNADNCQYCVVLGSYAGQDMTNNQECIFLGFSTGEGNTGNNNVFLGSRSGESSGTATGCVYLGHNAGQSATDNNALIIANSNTATPLLLGDFSTPELCVNGLFDVLTGTVATNDDTETTVASFTITNDSVVHMTATVAGTETDFATTATYVLDCRVTSDAGVIDIGTIQNTYTDEDDADWAVTIDNDGSTIRVRVTGKAATTVNWACSIKRLVLV